MYVRCETLNLWYSADGVKAFLAVNKFIEKPMFGTPSEIPHLTLKVSSGRLLYSGNVILKHSPSAQGPGAGFCHLHCDKAPAPSQNITSYRRVVFCTNTARVALAQTCKVQLHHGHGSKVCCCHHPLLQVDFDDFSHHFLQAQHSGLKCLKSRGESAVETCSLSGKITALVSNATITIDFHKTKLTIWHILPDYHFFWPISIPCCWFFLELVKNLWICITLVLCQIPFL